MLHSKTCITRLQQREENYARATILHMEHPPRTRAGLEAGGFHRSCYSPPNSTTRHRIASTMHALHSSKIAEACWFRYPWAIYAVFMVQNPRFEIILRNGPSVSSRTRGNWTRVPRRRPFCKSPDRISPSRALIDPYRRLSIASLSSKMNCGWMYIADSGLNRCN